MKKNKLAFIESYSLKTIVLSVFVFFTTFIVIFILYLQFQQENHALNRMSEKVITSKGETVKSMLEHYINVPKQSNAAVATSLKAMDFSETSDQMPYIKEILLQTMGRIFSGDKYLSMVALGTRDGHYIGVGRNNITDKEYLILKSRATQGRLNYYNGLSLDEKPRESIENYDVSQRPWFRYVDESKKSSWTKAYRDFNSDSGISISFSSPVYDKKNRYIGVISSDLRLSRFSRYLMELTKNENNVIFIVNGSNQIIASSKDDYLISDLSFGIADQDGGGLVSVMDSTEPLIKSTVKILQNNPREVERIQSGSSMYFGKVMPVGNDLNLPGWRIVVLSAQDDLTGDLLSNRIITIILSVIIFALGSLIAVKLLSMVTNPILDIARQAPMIARRKWKPSLNHQAQFSEIRVLNTAFAQMSDELEGMFLKLENQLNIDEDTQLLTRRGLLGKFRECHEEQGGYTIGLLAIVALSNFNAITSSLGRSYGRDFVSRFIQDLQAILPAGTWLARDAEERFIICYPGVKTQEFCLAEQHKFERFFRGLDVEHDADGQVYAGNTGFVHDVINPSTLNDSIMDAYIALKFACSKGNGYSMLYHSDIRAEEILNINMLRHLKSALALNEFFLVFQPIVNLATRNITGAECLIRWRNAELGMVGPDHFIPLAEDTGFIVPLGAWVLDNACMQLSEKLSSGEWPSNFKLHVNISLVQLMQQDFAHSLFATLARHNIAPHNISIEITETSMMKETEILMETISTIRRGGVSVAIDDFGSGFSSLSYLHKLEFDTLKIDKDFVSDVLTDSRNESIVSAVIRLSHGFNVPLVAEGVETAEVADKLQAMGCQKAQGYYFARPMPLSEWPDIGKVLP